MSLRQRKQVSLTIKWIGYIKNNYLPCEEEF